MPLVAGGAVDQPLRLALDILALRDYAKARGLMDGATQEHPAPEWAQDLVFGVQEAIMTRQAGDGETE